MKRLLSFYIVFLFCLTASAQQEITFSTGYGSYLMNDLRYMQNNISQYGDLHLIKTTSFPAYFNYSLRYGYGINKKTYFGVVAGLMSTGARSSVSDYSGYAFSDINCTAYRFGTYIKQKVLGTKFLNKPLDFSCMIDFCGIRTNGSFTDSVRIYDTTIKEGTNLKLTSMGIYTEPLIAIDYGLTSFLSLEIKAGGALNLNLPFYYQRISNNLVYNDRKISPDWSGFRVGAGLVFRLK